VEQFRWRGDTAHRGVGCRDERSGAAATRRNMAKSDHVRGADDGAHEGRSEEVRAGVRCGERLHPRRYEAKPDRQCGESLQGRRAPQAFHFFTKDRRFGSLDWRGDPVDDGTYRLVNNRTLVIFNEFPKVTFHYRIRGKTITFAPVIPKGCSTFRCAWAISMAYPGESWQRAR
jgi:hypothetical protein